MFAWAPVQRFLVATRARTDLPKARVLLYLVQLVWYVYSKKHLQEGGISNGKLWSCNHQIHSVPSAKKKNMVAVLFPSTYMPQLFTSVPLPVSSEALGYFAKPIPSLQTNRYQAVARCPCQDRTGVTGARNSVLILGLLTPFSSNMVVHQSAVFAVSMGLSNPSLAGCIVGTRPCFPSRMV